MESNRRSHEQGHRERSPDRRRHSDQKRDELESRKRRRSKSDSPRRKERHHRESPSRNRPRDHSPRIQTSDHSRDNPREQQQHHRSRDRFRDRGIDEPRYRDRDIEQTRHGERGRDGHRYDRPRDRHGPREENGNEERTRRDGDRERQGHNFHYRERQWRERASPDARADGPNHRKRRRDDKAEEDISQYEFGGATNKESGEEDEDKTDNDKPDYGLSGKLTAETNTYRGVVIKYNEPEEARIPKTRWRLYGFKGEETLPTLYMHRQSAYLIGRNRKVVDMPVDHPSCSGQHAVLQYRLVEYEKVDGSSSKKVKPYIIDLESTNGTYLNNNRIDAARYYELKEGDMLKFGFSSREYILLHENSQTGDNKAGEKLNSGEEEKPNEEGV